MVFIFLNVRTVVPFCFLAHKPKIFTLWPLHGESLLHSSLKDKAFRRARPWGRPPCPTAHGSLTHHCRPNT